MNKRMFLLGILAIFSSLLLVACSGTAQPLSSAQNGSEEQISGDGSQAGADSEEKADGGELIVGLGGDIKAVDPAFAYDFITVQVTNQVTEGLLKFTKEGSLLPNLAESWENPDPLTHIFSLRQDVTFHDGSPMTVEDVIFSMERIRDPDTASYLAWMYDNVDTIEQTDDWTITVTMKEPDALFQQALATSGGQVINKAQFDANAENFGSPDAAALGTGPYKFASWSSGNEIVLERYDDYWGRNEGGPYLDRVVFKIVPDDTSRVTGLRTGEIDAIVAGVPVDLLPTVMGMDHVKLSFAESPGGEYIAFNTQRPPFDNIKVRQALNYAVDVVEVTESLLGDAGTPGRATLVPSSLWSFEREAWAEAYEKLPAYDQDLERTRQLLDESGVADQLDGTVITTHEGLTRMGHALALQAAAAEIGVDLEIRNLSVEDLISVQWDGARDYDMLVSSWASDFADPAGNLFPFFHSRNAGNGGSNFSNYHNSDVDRLLDQQNNLTDPAERSELLLEAQLIIAEDAPLIVFDYPLWRMALNEKFNGYEVTPIWYWDAWAKDIYVTE